MPNVKRNAFEQVAFLITGILLVLMPILKWINQGFIRGVILLVAILIISNLLQFVTSLIVGAMQKSNFEKMSQRHGAAHLEALLNHANYGGVLSESEERLVSSAIAPAAAQNLAYVFRIVDIAIPIILYDVI
jgi:hypothetical protein